MTRRLLLAAWIAAGLAPLGSLPMFAQAGETVAVVQRAVIRTDGQTVTLVKGQPVRLGDTIATGNIGQAQIIFPDETRVVVGPNSQMKVDRMRFRDDNTARRLTLSAVRGSFRFLSGNSPSRAYRLRTPTATMGVRGTSFDVAVIGQEETGLVVFDGEVRLCAGGRRCADVPGGCQSVRLNRRGDFAQPATVGEREEYLALFPFIANQDSLGPEFRARTELCDRGGPAIPLILLQPVPQIDLPAALREGSSRTESQSDDAREPERRDNPAQ